MRICTIVARNYLPYARVLTESFLAQHPSGESIVLVIDDRDGEVDESREPFRVLRPDTLSIERFEAMAAMYDVTELSTAVKPWLLEHLLFNDDAGPIAYFDPDIRFYAPVETIEQLAEEHELVLIPHITAPIPDDGHQPGELDLMASGVYNLGFVAMAPSERVRELLRWWQNRLRYDCVIDHALGYFVDQRWFDLVPNTFEGTAILRDPGMNVAYWNLHERTIARARDGRWLVNEQALRFYHFSGFNPETPHLLSKHQTRTRLSEHLDLAQLCAEFAQEVENHRRPGEQHGDYAWDELGDGRKLDRRLRRLYREGERAGAFRLSPFDRDGAQEFVDWLREPITGAGRNSISRFWTGVYHERPDLRTAFPDLAGDAEPFQRWIEANGHEMGDVRGLISSEQDEMATLADAGITVTNLEPGEPWGVNVAGFLQSELGIGEAARGLISALDAVRIPLLPVHGHWRPSSRQDHAYAMFDTDAAIFPVNIVCVNADVLAQWMAQAGESFRAGRYTIGLWWWEVNAFPGAWLPAFDLVDEVWVATQHVADSLMPVSSVPVTKVTMPVSCPPARPRARGDLGLPEGFLFMFIFDYHSVFERKNPLAIIEAFKRAFPAGSGASLVVKSINHEHHLSEHERLLLAAADHPNIHLIDRYVSAGEKNSMIASADCYVSLHRAEGFGLTMAEAMCLGKPVIATRYGGNLEFMNDRNSWLVDYEMTAIQPGCYPYPPSGSWADPDVGQAARHMRTVFEDSEEVRDRARRGQQDLRERHSPLVAGRSMENRLEHIRARRAHWPRRTAVETSTKTLARPTELIGRGPQPPRRSPFGPFGRFLRRVVLRLIKPYTAYQHMVNSELLQAIQALTEEQNRMVSALQDHRLDEARRAAAQLGELRRQFAWIEETASQIESVRTKSAPIQQSSSTTPLRKRARLTRPSPEIDLGPDSPRIERRVP
jgi:glycosyltransferase involved in cell wall biosynthesis